MRRLHVNKIIYPGVLIFVGFCILHVNNVAYGTGAEAYKDRFVVLDEGISGDQSYKDEFALTDTQTDIKLPQTGEELLFKKVLVELPLYSADYYYGKHTNASAAASEINALPILRPGDHFAILGDNIITFSATSGYIQPPGNFYYASGACWATSTLGLLMDEANKRFARDYGIPLFVFESNDRYPHTHAYQTYAPSNSGYGYTVSQIKGAPAADYRFTLNPQLSEIPALKDIQIKIIMLGTKDHPTGYLGESIDAYIESNIDF